MGRAVRVDSTVVEADVRYPSFAVLALQVARVLAPEGASCRSSSVRRCGCAIGRDRIAELSRSLYRRDDHGEHAGLLGRGDIALFLARLGRAHANGRMSTYRRAVLIGDVAYFLRGARNLGLGTPGRPMFGLAAEFSLYSRGRASDRSAPGAGRGAGTA